VRQDRHNIIKIGADQSSNSRPERACHRTADGTVKISRKDREYHIERQVGRWNDRVWNFSDKKMRYRVCQRENDESRMNLLCSDLRHFAPSRQGRHHAFELNNGE
jgi:hypothetical protein